jgi:hypothetical protein
MAAVKGVNRTLYDAGGESKVAQGQTDARVKCNIDTYVPLGTEAAGSTIAMGPTLPANAKIVGQYLAVLTQEAGVTLAVGDSNDADRYITAIAADSVLFSDNLRQIGAGYVIGTNTGDNQILITTAGNTLGVGDSISLITFYTID